MTQIDYIKSFLENNGFTQTSSVVFKNDRCIITVKKNNYEVRYNDEHQNYWFETKTISIPELLGYLLWNDLIDKNFKK